MASAESKSNKPNQDKKDLHTLFPPTYKSCPLISVNRTFTKRLGVVKRWEWIWVIEAANSSFWEGLRGQMCSISYMGILKYFTRLQLWKGFGKWDGVGALCIGELESRWLVGPLVRAAS